MHPEKVEGYTSGSFSPRHSGDNARWFSQPHGPYTLSGSMVRVGVGLPPECTREVDLGSALPSFGARVPAMEGRPLLQYVGFSGQVYMLVKHIRTGDHNFGRAMYPVSTSREDASWHMMSQLETALPDRQRLDRKIFREVSSCSALSKEDSGHSAHTQSVFMCVPSLVPCH